VARLRSQALLLGCDDIRLKALVLKPVAERDPIMTVLMFVDPCTEGRAALAMGTSDYFHWVRSFGTRSSPGGFSGIPRSVSL
jgi:hypothetical protein